MKIAVLAHSFPRFPGDTHGPFVKSLCESIARLGHEVHVLVPWDAELRPDPTTPLHIHSFRYVWPDRWHLLGYSRTLRGDIGIRLGALLLSPLYFWFAERALLRLVRAQTIDLMHAHWLLPNGFVAARVKRATGVPFVVTLHGSDIFMAERNLLFRRLGGWAAAAASHITSCSADLRSRLLRLPGTAAPARVLLVANGTDVAPAPSASAAAMRQRLGIAEADQLIVAVGRMVYKKGFRYLLEAAASVFAKFPRARLVIGGGGDLLAELRAQAATLGIGDRVLFPGGLSHDEVLAVIAAGDIFVMPSIRDPKGNIDGLPIVVLEAMAAGKPVVATAVSGMPMAVVDGVTGRLVAEKDPAALAAALGELLASPERVRTLGDAGRERVRRELNWDEIARRHDELYGQVQR